MDKTGYIFLALALLLALGTTGPGFSVYARPADWSTRMNSSGDSAGPIFEVFGEPGKEPFSDADSTLNLSGNSVRQQWNVPMNLSGNSVESLNEVLVEFCQDVAGPLNLSGNSVRQQWSAPMNLSGNWAPSLFEIFEELFSDVDNPLNLSGNSARQQWSSPMNLSGNGDSTQSLFEDFEELFSEVDSPLNLSGNSVRQQWSVPMNLSGNSAPSRLEILEEVCQYVGSPLNLSGNSVKHHLGGSMEDDYARETQEGEKLDPELLPGFDLFNKMSRDGVLVQCVNDIIPHPPVIVNQIIPVDTPVTFELQDIDPSNIHQRYRCDFLLQDNYPKHVSAVVWADETHQVSSFNCVHCIFQLYDDGLYIFFNGTLIKIQDWQQF